MSKSEIMMQLATLPDNDARLDAIAGVLDGSANRDKTPGSTKLLSMGQACNALNVSRPTLWRLIRDGQIKAIELRPGSKRVPETEVYRFAAGGMV